jgi:glutathione synthase/RimK-type ligase-like ATP-grasp enzyme
LTPRITFITDRERPEGTADDRIVAVALRERGVDVQFAAWESIEDQGQLFVVRSPWNYHRTSSAFLDRLRLLSRLLNPLPLLAWNSDKRYLVELAGAGVPTIPTCFADDWEQAALGCPWTEGVVKPIVSAAGEGTVRWQHRGGGLEFDRSRAPAPGVPCMVQPFLPEVLEDGELSVVIVAGEVTHIVRKRGASGNFLVHEEHGGRVEGATLSAALATSLADASLAAVRAAPADPFYARVDWIVGPQGPRLVELELIEPELFFRFDPARGRRFVDGLIHAAAAVQEAPGAVFAGGGR